MAKAKRTVYLTDRICSDLRGLRPHADQIIDYGDLQKEVARILAATTSWTEGFEREQAGLVAAAYGHEAPSVQVEVEVPHRMRALSDVDLTLRVAQHVMYWTRFNALVFAAPKTRFDLIDEGV